MKAIRIHEYGDSGSLRLEEIPRLSISAAALPTAGSTALQVIRDIVGARPGVTILIHGAAGGVGSFATQIATHLARRSSAPRPATTILDT